MKLIIFNEKFKKSDVIKKRILSLVMLVGLILSCVLAYINIDFMELLKIFDKNIFNAEILNELKRPMYKWYIISAVSAFVAVILFVIYSVQSRKKDEDTLTWGKTIFEAIEIILIAQIILPLNVASVEILVALLYLNFFSSILLKNIIEYGTAIFVLVIEKICAFLGITLTYGEFIGQEKYSVFLRIIIILILMPYGVHFWIRMIKKFIQKVTGWESVELIFKLVEVITSINVMRYAIYIILFFISIFTYSVNLSQSDYFFSIIKEALLEFVLLDTVIYSIISNMTDKKEKHKQQNIREYYIPFKYDLESVLYAIIVYDLRNREICARIKFSVDINEILKEKGTKEVSDVNKLLIDISTTSYKIDVLEQKIKIILRKIY